MANTTRQPGTEHEQSCSRRAQPLPTAEVTDSDIARLADGPHQTAGRRTPEVNLDNWLLGRERRDAARSTTASLCWEASSVLLPSERLLGRIRAEYLETPGLCLTPEQMQRLCGVEPTLC